MSRTGCMKVVALGAGGSRDRGVGAGGRGRAWWLGPSAGGGVRGWGLIAWGVAVAGAGGCAPAAVPEAEAVPAPESRRVGAVGREQPGSLRQREISVRLASGALQIEVTPLAGWVLEAAAPDTRDRLRRIAEAYGPELAGRTGAEEPALFLVSLSSRRHGTVFAPDDLHMVSRGLRERPLAIRAITPGWGSRRLSQQATEAAVYAYGGGLDLTRELTVVYQEVEDSSWRAKVAAIEAERARIGRGGRSRRQRSVTKRRS